MNERTTGEHEGDEVSTRDLLISRLIDASDEGLAAEDERVRGAWEELRALAAQDGSVWHDLATAQYQHAALRGEADRALAGVHRVGLPIGKQGTAKAAGASRETHLRCMTRNVALGGGWLAAAVLAVMWVVAPGAMTETDMTGGDVRGHGGEAAAGAHLVNTTDDAIKAYLALGGEDGRVIGEVSDRSVVRWRRRPSDGKIEAIVQRSFLERDILDDVYTVGQDEFGRSVAVPVSYSGPSEDGGR